MELAPRTPRAWRGLALRLAAFVSVLVAAGAVVIPMPGRSFAGALPPMDEDEARLERRLREHVTTLASRIGERNVDRAAALEDAAKWIESSLREIGLEPSSQAFSAAGTKVRNVEATIAGRADAPLVVIGAHYDSAPGTPGANDNGTGTAALVEIARALKDEKPSRELRLVFFVNEEPPFFQTDAMGSLVHARRLRAQGKAVDAMISLETIGFYDDAKGSQKYPPIFSAFYPDTGNFLGFVGNVASRSLVRRVVGAFREVARFPSEGVAAPSMIPGIGWSDQWAYWEEGYPGVMVTDTAPFRYPHYHLASDTPDKVDYERLARVTAAMARTIRSISR